MKKINKVVSVLCVGMIAASSIVATGCNFNDVEEYDETRTQLFVEVYNGGFGTEWLNSVKTNFENEYKDQSFGKNEDGEDLYGVEVIIRPKKESVSYDMVPLSDTDVYINENIDVQQLRSVALDVTDIVTTPNPKDNNKTIESKIPTERQELITYGDGKYFAIPHSEYYTSCFTYDIDLFEQKLFYFADDRDNGNGGFITSLTDKKSKGPDGEYNTQDDGLPCTYQELYQLCAQMSNKNVTPFVWAGDTFGYITRNMWVLTAGLEGDSFTSRWTLDSSTARIVTGYTGSNIQLTDEVSIPEPIVEEVPLTFENGYQSWQSEGLYYALNFLQQVNKNGWYDSDCYSNVFTYTEAQEKFLYSRLDNEPIGFLIDGNYWENEAKAAFARSVEDYGSKAENRRFGIMPVPTALLGTEASGEGTIVDCNEAFMFINKTAVELSNKEELAKLFLQYCATDEMCQDFTKHTNATKALDYEIDDDTFNSLSTLGKQVWEMKKNSKVVYHLAPNELVMSNVGGFQLNYMTLSAQIDGGTYTIADAFKKNRFTAKQFFEGLKALHTETMWDNSFSKYFPTAND